MQRTCDLNYVNNISFTNNKTHYVFVCLSQCLPLTTSNDVIFNKNKLITDSIINKHKVRTAKFMEKSVKIYIIITESEQLDVRTDPVLTTLRNS